MFQDVSSNRCPFKYWRQTDGILLILLFCVINAIKSFKSFKLQHDRTTYFQDVPSNRCVSYKYNYRKLFI